MNIWSEIRSDFEDEGIIHIDAWVSDDENEDGSTIALVNPDGSVVYNDNRAKKDFYAQEVINEVIKGLKK